MRTIIRFSLSGDEGALTFQLRKILAKHGIEKSTRSSTYEVAVLDELVIGDALNDFWDALKKHKAEGGKASLDHFWMYVDAGSPEVPYSF